tara:strand:- start:1528 stop:1806 length:279 start_codon:yes stop_codon:yes gene_type:complete
MSNDPKKPKADNDNSKKNTNNQPDAGKVLGLFILGTAAAGGLAAAFKAIVDNVENNPRPANGNRPATKRTVSKDMQDKLKRKADRPKRNYFD